MNRDILRIALPSIITNITVPLIGLVDLAIVGHIGAGSSATIGAISVGTMIFNMVYWIFNFLRFGSSGLTAQAFGRKDRAGIRKVFRLAITVAAICGFSVILLQRPIEWLSGWVISPSHEVWQLAIEYFRIRVWAAPAVIMLFAMNGWFVGMQNSRLPMYIAIGQNLVNIAVSACLVFVWGMGIAGVAIGTVVSQYVGLVSAFLLWKIHYSDIFEGEIAQTADVSLHQFFSVNRDIFLRMIFMLAVTCAFTSFSARMGDDFLAANTLLMQLFILFSYFSDGFALAGEALIGKYVGLIQSATCRGSIRQLSAMKHALRKCIKLLFAWAGVVTIIFTLAYVSGIDIFLWFMTSDNSIVIFSHDYVGWAMLIPVASFAAFAWDGIYIGATATWEMLLTLVYGAAAFFATYFVGTWLCSDFAPQVANHVLWFAFIAYLATRSIAQTIMAKRITS